MIVLTEYHMFHQLRRTVVVQVLNHLCMSWCLHTVQLPDGQHVPVANYRDLLRKYQYALFLDFGVCVVMNDSPVTIAKSPLCHRLDEFIVKENVECFKV